MQKTKKKKTGFERFAQNFLIITSLIFAFGITWVKSCESSYNKEVQILEKEIKKTKADIDSLEMQKQELTAFNRVAEIATNNGCTYQSYATASLQNSADSNDRTN